MNENIKELLTKISGGGYRTDDTVRGATCAEVELSVFAKAAKVMKSADFRLAAEWAANDSKDEVFTVYAAYNQGGDYIIIKSPLPEGETSFPTLTKEYISALRFEKQIESLMGLKPVGHPDPRPWIKHEDWPEDAYPLRKSFEAETRLPRVNGSYRWIRAEGEGVFEIPVGPVHAGIIEPGHFRFQAVGEDIINLETRFGYVHKGIEKRFESIAWKDAARLAGRVSGDSTVAHAVAFCMAVEAASDCSVPARAQYLRALMIERERIANHIGDVGAIANDTAFAFLNYQCSILREKVVRTNLKAFGHRFMMDKAVPGGVSADITKDAVNEMLKEAEEISGEFERLVSIYEDNASVEDRVYGTGVLKAEAAKKLGVVGFVARASGQKLDVRLQCPFPPYDRIIPNVTVLNSGDVHARAWVRIEEVRESLRLMTEIAGSLPEGPLTAEWKEPAPGTSGFSAVEGWRGEILYWVLAGADGKISRSMVRDPSTVTWIAIEHAIKGNIVPDFPLCNKSFNQSYSGNDL